MCALKFQPIQGNILKHSERTFSVEKKFAQFSFEPF